MLFHLLMTSNGQQDEDALSNHLALSLALKQQELKHTHRKFTSRWRPCKEISDRNVSFVKAVGRFSNKVVEVDPFFTYDVSFCNTERSQECAKDSLCSTVYRWQPARTRSILLFDDASEENEFVSDEILVPSGCMCVIGAKKKNTVPHPIILE
uniref:Spaetzle domain-containing protein n=1 Tax=Acrobeloides nanus TaxID=290746 RepID=A0A914E662_9BILA